MGNNQNPFDPVAGLQEFQQKQQKRRSYEHQLIGRLLTRKGLSKFKTRVANSVESEDGLMTMEGLLTLFPNFPVYIDAHEDRLKAKYFSTTSMFKYFGTSFLFKKFLENQKQKLGDAAGSIPFAMVYRGEKVPIGLVLSNMMIAPDENKAVFMCKHRKLTYCMVAFDDFITSIPDWDLTGC